MRAQLVKKYLIPNTALTSILKMMGEKYFIDIHINMTLRPGRGRGGRMLIKIPNPIFDQFYDSQTKGDDRMMGEEKN